MDERAKISLPKILGVEYITRKTLLNPSKIEWVDRCCNHYWGCAHGCKYPCYARIISRRSPEAWSQVKVVENALELIKKEIPKLKEQKLHREEILLSSMTDPYQPIEREQYLTNWILREFIRENMRFKILTKSDLITRDLELLTYAHHARVGFTFITLDEKQRKLWEPNSSSITKRASALIKAHYNYNLPTFVSMEPIILGVTKPLEIIEEFADEVDFWIFGKHNYAPMNLEHHYVPMREQIIKECKERGLKYQIKEELLGVNNKAESYQMKLNKNVGKS